MPTSSEYKIVSNIQEKSCPRKWGCSVNSTPRVRFSDQQSCSLTDNVQGTQITKTYSGSTQAAAQITTASTDHCRERTNGGGLQDSGKIHDDDEPESTYPSNGLDQELPTTSIKTVVSIKHRLYCLGFRALPGQSGADREKLNDVLKHRHGMPLNEVKRAEEKPKVEVPIVIEGITNTQDVTIDMSSLDPALLRPTALCFEEDGLDISHQQLKKALDKVLLYCDGAVVKTIQYENRRVKVRNLPNRWMIYADTQESRNIIGGRQMIFGDRCVVLRRHDDLVLLAHKKALRAQAWKEVLERNK